MEFEFKQRVRVVSNRRTDREGMAGQAGHVFGKSRKGSPDVVAYTVLLDSGSVYAVKPDEIEPEYTHESRP